MILYFFPNQLHDNMYETVQYLVAEAIRDNDIVESALISQNIDNRKTPY